MVSNYHISWSGVSQGPPAGARLSPFRGFLRRGLCRHQRDGLMQQSPSLGDVGDVRVIAAPMGYWPSQSVESISTPPIRGSRIVRPELNYTENATWLCC